MGRSLDDIQDIVKNVIHSENKYVLLTRSSCEINTTHHLAVPFKKWRVRAMGFVVLTDGVTTENPIVYFGKGKDDVSADDVDGFWKVTQDVTGAKHFVAGDCLVYDPIDLVTASLALNGGGTPTQVIGTLFDVWQTAVGTILIHRGNDHALGVIPFVLLEVEIR